MSPLTPIEDALTQLLSEAHISLPVERMSLAAAVGRVLAADVVATIDVPGDDNSAMDGYAIKAAESGQPLNVSQRIAAGTVGAPLEAGTAARIFTGAPIPEGADAVVMQEMCEEVDGKLRVTSPNTNPGQHIRRRGQDIAAGSTVLMSGRRLQPQDIGLLASLGIAEVAVYRPLKVAILSTGDELVEPGTVESLESGQLYNSNRYTLTALLAKMGAEVIDCGLIADDPDATREALLQAADSADCVISSGGVSVGEEDHVKTQLEKIGQLKLWKLAIKPGKPLAFGRIGEVPFLGLPGNPASVFVTFCLIARPLLQKMQGLSPANNGSGESTNSIPTERFLQGQILRSLSQAIDRSICGYWSRQRAASCAPQPMKIKAQGC